MDTTLAELRSQLRSLSDTEIAAHSQRFFKTGPGQYGEGDVFIGIRVPALRKLARRYPSLSRADARRLLTSKIHEERLLALLILVLQFSTGTQRQQENIYKFYLRHSRWINNWDLVDTSADKIVGAWLEYRNKQPLYELASSDCLWQRRIAIMSTFHFIKRGQFAATLKIAAILLQDPHDLIHKAVGWMLREVGNRDRPAEEAFLKRHYRNMPRTMLRYAIERFPERRRQAYLRGTVGER